MSHSVHSSKLGLTKITALVAALPMWLLSTDLKRPLLPDQVPSNSKRILVHSNDLRRCQDLLGLPAEAAQVCADEQG